MESEPWHALSPADAIARLDSDASGLSDEEAARRLARFGANRLERTQSASAWHILRNQLTSIVVLLLAAASVVTLAMGDYIDSAAIVAVLVLNTIIGFVTELRARRAMEALLQFGIARAVVVRGGRLRVIDVGDIVPGDVIELAAGRAVAADARLLHTTDLRASEAALTGESLPITKHSGAIGDETPLADRTNMVHMGTTITAGTGRGVVTATGRATELGQIGTLVAGIQEERTPLERRLDALGRRLVWLALSVAALVAALEAFHGASLLLVVETGIALAVAAVPEALPAVATIALAVGLHRMAKRHALVRRLPSVEALGSTTVICTDKTRTLTSGDMSVVRVWTADREFKVDTASSGADAHPLLVEALRVAALASRPQAAHTEQQTQVVRDPVDSAMTSASARFGIGHAPTGETRLLPHSVPFSSERKFMATFQQVDGRTIAYAKGAPQRLLELSERAKTATADRALDTAAVRRLLAVNDSLAQQGLRVLALASGPVEQPDESSLTGLTFVGFVGLMDPPAPGVKATIAQLRTAGLRTIMLTGDQRLTALAIGRDLGLLTADDQIIDGRELTRLTHDELLERVSRVAAFSRVAPQDKLTVIDALQKRGEIVAMLGDGVNDAPALKKSDVGVAMGLRGTDVAKEAASIVLQDDRFETIAAAVEEGRVIYDNIRKFVFYLFSCNIAEILVLLIAGLAALPPPLLPLQILWLNLVTDTFPALALAMEPGNPDVMRRAPRHPDEALLSGRFLRQIAFYGGLITVCSLGAFLWALHWSPEQATTISFMTLALAQIFHLGNARSPRAVVRLAAATSNPYALGALVLSVGLQMISVYVQSLRDLLRLSLLDGTDWAVVVVASAIPAVVGQAMKVIWPPES